MTILHRLFGRQTRQTTFPAGKNGRAVLSVGGATDRGAAREENEDAFFTLSAALSQEQDVLQMHFCAVADGMGGQENGQIASALAVRLVADWVTDQIYRPFLIDPGGRAVLQPISEVLSDAIAAANSKVRHACPNGGTTFTCAFVLGSNAFLAHVGDSRAYVIGPDATRRVTTDHSLVNRLIELGQVGEDEARTHPQRSVLYRALGRPGELQVDTHLQALPDGSGLLLCSDGLWSLVPEGEMVQIIGSASSPQAACQELVARANAYGGDDNITAVLVQA